MTLTKTKLTMTIPWHGLFSFVFLPVSYTVYYWWCVIDIKKNTLKSVSSVNTAATTTTTTTTNQTKSNCGVKIVRKMMCCPFPRHHSTSNVCQALYNVYFFLYHLQLPFNTYSNFNLNNFPELASSTFLSLLSVFDDYFRKFTHTNENKQINK